MKPNKQTYDAAVRFAQSSGFDGVTFEAEYKDCVAYYANSEALEGAKCGYPHFIIVNSNLNCRYSTPDEALAILETTKN